MNFTKEELLRRIKEAEDGKTYTTKEVKDILFKEEDNWNLEEQKVYTPDLVFYKKDIKTFIQKVKEDIDHQSIDLSVSSIKVFKIIDKRAGEL